MYKITNILINCMHYTFSFKSNAIIIHSAITA